jgi:hypothetical protein
MKQFCTAEAGCEFGSSVRGHIVMEGFMTVPVNVALKLNCQYPDLLRASVHHASFQHSFVLSLRQLSDGRHASMSSCESTVRPEANGKVSVRSNSWHWQIPVQFDRGILDEFLTSVQNFLQHA